MKLINTKVRRNIIAFAAAAVIATPALASAASFDRAKSGIRTIRTGTGILVTNVRQHRPLADSVNTVKGTTREIFDDVKKMNVAEQLRDTVSLVDKIQAEYQYFSGGEGCQASCASFRQRLKNVLNNFSQLVNEVPALRNDQSLVENMQRATDLIDYLPPRALYLMWQVMSTKLADIEATTGQIRQTLAKLPPLQPVGFDAISNATASTEGSCGWKGKDKDPWVKLVRGSLEFFAWNVNKIEGMIPDVAVKGQAGGTAGAAVVNGEAAAGVSVKPTDSAKDTFKIVTYIPELISKAIEMNILEANAVCQ